MGFFLKIFQVFLLLALHGGCQKKINTPSPPPLTSTGPAYLLAQSFESYDPRQDWLFHWTLPPISPQNQLDSKCVAPRTATIDFSRSNLSCSDLDLSFVKDALPTCTEKKILFLRIPPQNPPCTDAFLKSVVSNIRSPSLASLKWNPQTGLSPVNKSETPLDAFEIRFISTPQSLHWMTPPWQAWLKQTHPQGAVRIVLQATTTGKQSSNETRILRLFLQKFQRPKLFEPRIEAWNDTPNSATDSNETPVTPPVYFEVQISYPESSWQAESCGYLKTWVLAEQVALDPLVSKKRTVNFECKIESDGKPPTGTGLLLGRLALPYCVAPNCEKFPFVTLSESQSLQRLMSAVKESNP